MVLITIEIQTNQRNQFVDVTDKVRRTVNQSRVSEGLCCLYVPHTTAAVCINEAADPSVSRDIQTHLSRVVPERGDYQHLEGNSDAHIKSVLVGPTETIPIHQGRLVLGTWQGVFFCEFDGPRNRRLQVKILAG
ncbi:MAG: YjbQ family protein [Candidatus Desulforudis sp.]|nr:YjbQ family protein [Desulforudis sp.]